MAQVEKIYSLKTLGFDTIMTELDQLAKKFVEVKKAKQDAAKTAADAAKNQGIESQAYKDAAKALDEQKIKELELKAAIKEKTNEAKAAQLVRQADINQQKAAITGNAAEANSIAAIRKERAELNAAVIRVAPGSNVEFRGNTLQYDEAIAKLKELSSVEQAFRRQFQQDGTLVGEYTSGIIQAFKKMGIDDLVTGQVTKANEKLQNLNEQFEVLKNELRSIGTGSFEKLSAELNIVKNTGVSGFGSIEAKIKEVATSGGVSLGKIDQLLEEIKVNGNTALSGLEKELIQIRESATGALGNLEKELITNRKEALALQQQIGTLQTELRGTGDIGNQITTGLANGFKSMRGQLGQFLLSYVGFQAAFQGILSGIDTAKELADQTTNLEIELDKTAGGADKLVSALAKLNTRTKLTDLETIANIAAKAGVSEQNLLGVTEALDKIKIAFGKDFGDVEAGTESLVKLINIFEGADNVTGENLLKTGNAVRTLANESVASVPFLNDFAQRMAGLKGISDIALPAVLGLASGFEQFGQSSEVAGTALTKVIPKLASNTAKYAQIAGMTQKAFADLLQNNPAEALIRVSEALVKSKGGIEEISTAFADSQLGSGRIAAILGTVGAKADDFRKAIASAGQAFNNTGNIEDAFNAKNQNLASVLDKITKAFADAANSKAFQATLSIISTLILALIHNLPALITILSLYTTGWALANREMIIARAELIFQRTILPILTFLFGGQANAMKAYAVATQLAAAGLRLLTTLMGNPIFKIFAATIGLALIALESFGKTANNLGSAFTQLGAKQNALMEIQANARKEITETLAKEQALLAVVKDRTLADETRSKALTELKNLSGGYLDNLNLENVLTEKGTRLMNDFNAQLERRARLNAADAIAQRENNKLSTLYQYQFDIQNAIKTQGEVNTSQFSKEFLDAYYKQQGRSASAIGKFIGDKVGIDFTYSGKDLNDFAKLVRSQISDQLNKTKGALTAQADTKNSNINVLSNALKVAKEEADQLAKRVDGLKAGTKEYVDATAALNDAQNNVVRKRKELFEALGKPLATDKPAATVANDGSVDLEELKKQLASVNSQIGEIDKIKAKTDVQVTSLKSLRTRRAELIKEIKELGGSVTNKTFTGSKLSGEVKDEFSIIESNLRREVAVEETRVTEIKKSRKLTFDEEVEYVNNIQSINVKYINQKIGVLSAQKSLNAKEKEQLATFGKEKADIELRTVTDIQEIHNREFTERQTVLKNQLDEDIAAIKEANDVIQSDPDALPSTKAQARVNADNKILALVQKYNTNIDTLEKQLNANTVKNNKDLINLQVSTKKDALSATKDLDVSILADIDKTTAEAIAKIKLRYDQLREDILKSKDSQAVKNTNLQTVDNAENLAVGSTVLGSAAKKKAAAQALFDAGLITAEQFQTIFDAANAAQKNLNDTIEKTKQKYTDLRSLITGKLSTLFKFDVDTESGKAKAELLSQTLSQAYSVAQSAMDNYYAAEAAQIERSRTNNEKALQLEFDQKKSKAQSQAEQESLDKQFQARKEANDRDAFEKNKKIQREQAKVNLAIQLSNLAVIAFSPNPANIATLGIAGTIMYAIQAALALANYALNVGRINSAQFALGGEVPKRGGKFGGKPHSHGGTKFQFQGEQYEAEVDELAIIRTRNAPARNKIFQIAGTHQQIASQLNVLGGGIQFAPGAKLKRFEAGGALGATLQAPVFIPSSNSSVINNNNAELIAEIRGLRTDQRKTADEQSRRIDRIKVAVNAHDIRKVSNQIDKAAKVGTL